MGVERKGENRLATAKSQYLLRHAHNPVDWYMWGEEAFERARAEDKPIFLSIGYLACHWCSVMERESFEDEETAKLLNRHFVAVKVDREEHPHVDEYYMRAVQLMTGTGGWPLTVFLTPDLKPFYGGTYFPKEPRYGLPSFKQVLQAVLNAWKSRREEIETEAERVDRLVRETFALPRPRGVVASANEALTAAFDQLVMLFDEDYGGFGTAPKFPQVGLLLVAARHSLLTGNSVSMGILTRTLNSMMRGGIMDQVGGGFHRYAVDRAWRVPHFEKMLYDNALLLLAYSEGYLLTGKRDYARVVRMTIEFLMRELRSESGGFCSSLDAESEGEEGRYYTWSYSELLETFGEEQGKKIARFFGATEPGNFEAGRNVLFAAGDFSELAAELNVGVDEALSLIRDRLMKARSLRVKPERDEKVIACWNGLAVSGLSLASVALEEPRYLNEAQSVMDSLTGLLIDGRHLWRYWMEGRGEVEGRSEDYAAIGRAAFDLWSLTGEEKYLELAATMMDVLLDRFVLDDGVVLYSPREERGPQSNFGENYEGVLPTGASLSFSLAAKLFHCTGSKRYGDAAESIAKRLSGRIAEDPLSFPYFVAELPLMSRNARELFVVGRGPPDRELLLKLYRSCHPYSVLTPMREGRTPLLLRDVASDKKVIGDGPTFYLCEGFACRLPTNEVQQVLKSLQPTG
ncbi:MAG: thioredoxin domain-containing protein [Thaumarchaeota archaeon]|nr:thioredoxin domain-containing protein [Candidatus Calditenuaceae archaeon]MDW8187297.1 thioredoxin domain-containing protein [Nitrososphaerota archaeon]